ncbi:hypothetical protein GCM10009678_24480 [Actinomadura kijaniata]|uniref:Uncharacterized protein n=2 Tax=Actinomadura TaxID=1988 RepID=A0A7W3LP63_ACTNM|nr:hypothetical protein [Actinomadura namibiensis]MBA8951736.1 hypothetical protein [Actinomadura namibiensis]
MPKTWMIAEYLRPVAQWRIDRAEPRDEGRNARAAIGLLDAAAYLAALDDGDPAVARLAVAGCFTVDGFDPGPEGEAIVRDWHYESVAGGPADLLAALADAAERARASGAAPAGGRLAARSGAGRGPSLPRPRVG